MLLGNSGDAKVAAKQVGLNVALKSAKTNQLNAGQNSASVGSESDSSNLISVDQTNGAAGPTVVLRTALLMLHLFLLELFVSDQGLQMVARGQLHFSDGQMVQQA